MKKAFFFLIFLATLAACGNDSNSSSTDTNPDNGIGNGPRSTDADTAAANVHSVINANGNMPDTSNSINIGTETKGTTSTDSTKQ